MGFFRSNKQKTGDERTDEYLLERYRKTGDSVYFGELYDRYIPLLYGVCLKYLQNKDEAQDAVMQIFEDLLPKIVSYDIQMFKPWLYNVTKNYCLKVLKSKKRELVVDFDSSFMESDEIMSLSNNESDRSYELALAYCKAKLPDNQQIALDMFFTNNLSYADISRSLNVEVKTIKSQIQNGKRNLKNCIEKRLKNEIS